MLQGKIRGFQDHRVRQHTSTSIIMMNYGMLSREIQKSKLALSQERLSLCDITRLMLPVSSLRVPQKRNDRGWCHSFHSFGSALEPVISQVRQNSKRIAKMNAYDSSRFYEKQPFSNLGAQSFNLSIIHLWI